MLQMMQGKRYTDRRLSKLNEGSEFRLSLLIDLSLFLSLYLSIYL